MRSRHFCRIERRPQATGKLSLIVASLFAFTPSVAEPFEDYFIGTDSAPGLVRYADLAVNDQVVDGCWTNPSTVESKAKLMLEQNGVSVQSVGSPTPVAPSIIITVVGSDVGSNFCVGAISLSVKFGGMAINVSPESNTRITTFARSAIMFERTASIHSPKPMNNLVWDFVDGDLSEFLARVLASRDDPSVLFYFETFPAEAEKPMTRDELMQLYDSRPTE